MSGICAVWRTDGPHRVAETLAAVGNALSSNGNGQFQQHADADAGIAVCARFATQQIYQNPRVMVACHAEFYNEDELESLLPDGELAVPGSRTAALLAGLYERFGPDFVGRLSGRFSLALWDRRERRLMAAVDRFGMNRLAFYQNGKVLLVASRIDAMLRSGDVDPEINPRAIANFLNFSVVLGPESIFATVRRLPPGSLLIASSGQIRIQKYWDMRYGAVQDSSEMRLSRKMESLVERSVATHCKADAFAELGAYLSGGTDSSTVVGMMSRMGKRPVNAFSIGFEEQSFNELEYAEIAARKFNAAHHKYLVSPADCFEALPRMIRAFDEPFGNSSAIPTYFCARLAAQHGVKALLAGDGGDELFGGNERYRTDKIFQVYQSVPQVFRKGLIEPALSILPGENGVIGKARRYVGRSNMAAVPRMLSHQFLGAHLPAAVFEADFLHELGGYSILEVPARYYDEAPAHDHLDRLLYLDVKITLGDSDLPKVTCMSELAGVETRFPFLDLAVAEFSGRVPSNLKLKGFQKRYLFKRAFAQLLPPEIIRKTKHGFGIPVALWMKSYAPLRELAHDVLLSRRTFERGYFRRDFMEELFRKHAEDDSSYYGDIIWTFLTLELWHRECVEARMRAAV